MHLPVSFKLCNKKIQFVLGCKKVRKRKEKRKKNRGKRKIGVNERFNRSLKEEFMEINPYFEPYLYENNLDQANKELTEYLIFYNFKRPHQTLKYQTPIEYCYDKIKFKQVLPMYPTYTSA